jgi:alpha,alpha-trehalase
MKQLLRSLSREFDKLRNQVIQPAKGILKYDYLIPGGFYKQMWDWDGFFIGIHLATRSREKAKYLQWWVLNFTHLIDRKGYVSGCITPDGFRKDLGTFSMKPFLAQGCYFASAYAGDFTWIKPVFAKVKKVIAYREKTQFDKEYGLFFWDGALQSGADNNPALTNDKDDKSALLACDINTFQLRESVRNLALLMMNVYIIERPRNFQKQLQITCGLLNSIHFTISEEILESLLNE